MEVICCASDLRFKNQPNIFFGLTWFSFEDHHVVLKFLLPSRHVTVDHNLSSDVEGTLQQRFTVFFHEGEHCYRGQ